MEFCQLCDNMLYMKVNKDNDMSQYCRSCGNENSSENNESIKIMEKNVSESKSKYEMYLNKNIIHDNTLPRINNIECPSSSCTKESSKQNEVIFVKYDHDNMKFLYICSHCNYVWEKE